MGFTVFLLGDILKNEKIRVLNPSALKTQLYGNSEFNLFWQGLSQEPPRLSFEQIVS